MGFGIALFGYAFFLLQEIGGATIGAIMLAYGFFLASRLNAGFMRASVASLFMLPRGIFDFLVAFKLIDIDSNRIFNISTHILHLIAWMFMTYFWMTAVAEIARSNKATKLENGARFRLVLTEAFIMFSIAIILMQSTGMAFAASLGALQYILQYVVIIINILFLHTCFVLITSERQYEKDKQQLAKERADTLSKQQQKTQEVRNKLERKK